MPASPPHLTKVASFALIYHQIIFLNALEFINCFKEFLRSFYKFKIETKCCFASIESVILLYQMATTLKLVITNALSRGQGNKNSKSFILSFMLENGHLDSLKTIQT